MEVKISEEYDTSSVICLELDDDHQLSLEYLCSCFPGATGLKFKNLTTGNWTGIKRKDEKFIFQQDDFDPNIVYVVIRPMGSNPTSPTPTPRRSLNTPPLTTHHMIWDYLRCLASKTEVLRERLRQIIINKNGEEPMSDYLDECSICLDKLSDDNITTVMTTCSHRYHRICLKKWIESNGEYSLCRYSLANDRYIEQNGDKKLIL